METEVKPLIVAPLGLPSTSYPTTATLVAQCPKQSRQLSRSSLVVISASGPMGFNRG